MALILNLLVGLTFIGQAGSGAFRIRAGVIGSGPLKRLTKVDQIYSELNNGSLELRQARWVVKDRRWIVGLCDERAGSGLRLAAVSGVGNPSRARGGCGPSGCQKGGEEGELRVHQKS